MKVSKVLRLTITFIGGAIIGAAIVHFIKHNVDDIGTLDRLPVWQLLIWIMVIYYIEIAAHECGHWLAGLAMRFRTVRISVGPFMLNRHDGKTSLLCNGSVFPMEGCTFMVPEDNHDLAKRFGWFIAGGPLTSLIIGIACFVAIPMLQTSWFKIAVMALGCISFLFTVITLVPTRTGGFHSDGAKLLVLWRGGDGAKHLLALLRLTFEFQTGTRPRDWPVDAVAMLEADALEGSDNTTASAMLYAYAQDTENVGLARTVLDHQLASMDGEQSAFHTNWFLEAALFAARYEGDPIKAREWQEKGKDARLVDAVVLHMLDAEILFAETRFAEARRVHEKATSARAKVKFLPKGYPIDERLGDLDQRIRNAESALTAV